MSVTSAAHCIVALFIASSATIVLSAGIQSVTCGSVLKLINPHYNVRLHSHDVKYGSGSAQQSVTGVTQADDINSYWVLKGAFSKQCPRGVPVKCGFTVRLQHLSTHLFLHSHHFASPLSSNQEVSCFGDAAGGSDSGDNWVVECSSEYWRRDESVRLKHVDTGMYLQASPQTYGRPINGQREICAAGSKSPQNLWKTMEGVYMEPSKTL